MNELEFAELIDCGFPYEDARAAEELIVQAHSISLPAMFMVLEELCRPPVSSFASEEILLNLIDVWRMHIDHPLAESVAKAACTMVNNSSHTVSEAIVLMEQIAPFHGLYPALNIAYFCCNDVDGVTDLKMEQIRADWERSRLTH